MNLRATLPLDRFRFTWQTSLGTGLLAATVVIGAVQCSFGSEPDQMAFCDALAASADLDDRLTLDALTLAGAASELDELARHAPDDIEPAVRTLQRALSEMSAAVAAADTRDAVDAALGAVGDDLDEIDAASATLDRYAEQNCGVDLEEIRPSPLGERSPDR